MLRVKTASVGAAQEGEVQVRAGGKQCSQNPEAKPWVLLHPMLPSTPVQGTKRGGQVNLPLYKYEACLKYQ